jgi:hypothetical protein
MSDNSAVNEHLASQVPSARSPAAPAQNSSPPAPSAPGQSADPAHGTMAFIDGSHGRDGFNYVGRPGAGRGFSGQEVTPRYDDSEDD